MGSEVDEGAEAGTFGVDLDSTEFHKQSGDGDFWILTPSSGSLAGRGVLTLPVERFDGALLIAVPATAWGARVAKRCLPQAQTLKAMTVEVEVEVDVDLDRDLVDLDCDLSTSTLMVVRS